MNIHEYQAKGLLKEFGVPVPQGGLAVTPQEARAVAESLPGPVWVVKAQIHAGGRGKGGGVKVCKSPDAVEEAARAILGMQLVTHQTGPEGKKVHKVWVEQGTDIARELYLSVVLDRAAACLTVMASPDGGMTIAASSPAARSVEASAESNPLVNRSIRPNSPSSAISVRRFFSIL